VKIKSLLLNVVLPVAVLVGTGATIRAFMSSRPATPQAPPMPTGQVVNAITVERAVARAEVKAVGRVKPARELTVLPEVAGRLVELHPELQPGGIIRAGETIVRIDDRPYRMQVSQQEANAAARVELQVEAGRRSVAEREWSMLESEVQATADGKDLALRKPYERLAQVKVASAGAALARARLDVERTVLAAPFNALVREEAAEPGMLAGPQTPIARLVGTDAFWVEVTVPDEALARLRVPSPGAPASEGAAVVVRRSVWNGRIIRLLGDLDTIGAQARLLVQIDDPLALATPGKPLLLNSFVEVSIASEPLPDAVRLPRVALREGDIAWVLGADDTISFRPLTIGAREKDHVLVTAGLTAGERVVTSRLAAPVPGMKVRVAGEARAAEAPSGAKPVADEGGAKP
jgi:RND family efflux transporter MFP subunit